MEILSIIPARGGSKGIPLKNITLVCGKPLIYYTISSSLKSKVDRTVVSTDNKKIASVALKFGAEVVHRPKILSTHKAQIELSIEHTLNYLEKKESYIPDVIVLLQNTSPLRTHKHLNKALKLFKSGNYDSILSGYISHSLLWTRKKRMMKPLNYNPLKRQNRQQMNNQYIENGAVYITKYNFFKKSKCRISGRIGIMEMPEELSLQLDSKHDLFSAEQILKEIK